MKQHYFIRGTFIGVKHDPKAKIIHTLFFNKWRTENEDNIEFHSYADKNGLIKYERIFEIKDNDLKLIKKNFLMASIFKGKSFWQVERVVAWLDEGPNIIIDLKILIPGRLRHVI